MIHKIEIFTVFHPNHSGKLEMESPPNFCTKNLKKKKKKYNILFIDETNNSMFWEINKLHDFALNTI
jgi:hypothetical protein